MIFEYTDWEGTPKVVEEISRARFIGNVAELVHEGDAVMVVVFKDGRLTSPDDHELYLNSKGFWGENR